MLKEWQFNVLFFVGVGGAIILLIGPEVGLQNSQNPTAVTGVGAILTYVLTQKRSLVKAEDGKKKVDKKAEKPSPGDSSDEPTESESDTSLDVTDPIKGDGDEL